MKTHLRVTRRLKLRSTPLTFTSKSASRSQMLIQDMFLKGTAYEKKSKLIAKITNTIKMICYYIVSPNLNFHYYNLSNVWWFTKGRKMFNSFPSVLPVEIPHRMFNDKDG